MRDQVQNACVGLIQLSMLGPDTIEHAQLGVEMQRGHFELSSINYTFNSIKLHTMEIFYKI